MEYLQYKKNGKKVWEDDDVLNLVISGIPSILEKNLEEEDYRVEVLNLVISGIPSIHREILHLCS